MANYPFPVFHFQVEWGGARIGFTEISGLDMEIQPIEYREGSSPQYNATKMPGLKKFNALTMKRGIMANDNDFQVWMSTAVLNTVERRNITISLLNESHEPVAVWTATDAWVSKYTGPSLNSTGNEVAIESIEVCFETLTAEVLA